MYEHTELENLDGLTSEVRDVRAALADLTAALDEVASWSQTLPDRWAGADGTTAGLDNAVRAIADMAAGLKLPPAVLEQLAVLEHEATHARTIGEAAADAGATGDLAAFTTATGAGGIDHGGDQARHEHAVERAVRQAYDMLVLKGEEDGREVRWVGLVALRGELEESAVHDGRLPYGREAVDAALQRLSRQPGIHVQAEANQQALTDEDQAAGVRFAGSTRHLLLIEDGA
ncbi:hypothetical protein ACFV9C_44505 [Kribbella sp. NPDC059898]|uniref:hypothetical protein n=1 Tax=Kribbella sp. NPDC059898 TaxID=3346995 RepID=UPI00366842CE